MKSDKEKVKKQKRIRIKQRKADSLTEQIKRNKKAAIVYFILRAITIGVMIRSMFIGQWESVFTCILTLVLFLVPAFVEKKLRISLPTVLEMVAFCFVFCAEILGEIGCYYVKYPFWDNMLHTVSGFMFAAFGFCIVDILNRNKNIRFELSPLSLAIVAFCFSMTTGVIWEFFEFGMDIFFRTDMQKDFIVQQISSVTLDPTASNTAVVVKGIVETVIKLADGSEVVIPGGYLDIGIIDTMKDLFVNFIGAVVFSLIGYFYVKHRGKGVIAPNFIPVVETDADIVPQVVDGEEVIGHDEQIELCEGKGNSDNKE